MTKERFISLWNRCLVDRVSGDPGMVFEDLIHRYSEPHRHYHTGQHIDRCLQQLDLAAELMDNVDTVEMALWFHDAIYDPQACDNELKSAQLFAQHACTGFAPEFTCKVRDLILITMHQRLPQHPDEKFIVDIDLSSFGLPWDLFRLDSEAVRMEYVHCSDADFYGVQLRFLRSLLDRPALYSTDFFRERYERIARGNIKRLIKKVHAQSLG